MLFFFSRLPLFVLPTPSPQPKQKEDKGHSKLNESCYKNEAELPSNVYHLSLDSFTLIGHLFVGWALSESNPREGQTRA